MIYGLPAAVRHWEAEGAVLRSPICYGGKQTRVVGFESSPLEAGATALRPRLLRKRRSGAERGNFVWERAALRGQRPGGGVRAPGNACFVVCKRRMDIKGHTDISRWILSLRFKDFGGVFFLVVFCFFSDDFHRVLSRKLENAIKCALG